MFKYKKCDITNVTLLYFLIVRILFAYLKYDTISLILTIKNKKYSQQSKGDML